MNSTTDDSIKYSPHRRESTAEQNEPPRRDYYQEKLDRWKEEWSRELDNDLEHGR